jgi:phospholipase/carboxylesterase
VAASFDARDILVGAMTGKAAGSEFVPVPWRVQFDWLAPRSTPAPLLAVLHGYGGAKGPMLEAARAFAPPSYAIVAVQGPHQHTRLSPRTGRLRAGYSWGTLDDSEAAAALHEQALIEVLAWAIGQRLARRDRIVLAGFSESVALNYRFAARHPRRLSGVLAFCGEPPAVPPAQNWPPIFHLHGASDPVVTLTRAAPWFREPGRQSDQLRFRVYEGGHEITAEMRSDARAWLKSLGRAKPRRTTKASSRGAR